MDNSLTQIRMTRQEKRASGNSAQKRLEMEERRAKVAGLILEGQSFREAATEVGVSVATICRDAAVICDRWQREQFSSIDRRKQLESRRIDKMFAAVWVKAIAGDLGAIDKALKLMERRAKLLGLDAPARAQVDVNTVEALLSLLPAEVSEEIRALLGGVTHSDVTTTAGLE